MNALFADTFYFLALINDRDTRHAEAVRYDAAQGAFLRLLDLLGESPDAHIIPPSSDLFERGVALYRQRSDKDWSLTDCLSFVAMADEHISEALTGDRHFEQAGFRALLK
jgi:predicted nucleic acid-binding protein